MKFLLLILLLGCSRSPERAMPEKIVDGIRYAYVTGSPDNPFIVYATGEISQEFYNCMERFHRPRRVPLPKAVSFDLCHIGGEK